MVQELKREKEAGIKTKIEAEDRFLKLEQQLRTEEVLKFKCGL